MSSSFGQRRSVFGERAQAALVLFLLLRIGTTSGKEGGGMLSVIGFCGGLPEVLDWQFKTGSSNYDSQAFVNTADPDHERLAARSASRVLMGP